MLLSGNKPLVTCIFWYKHNSLDDSVYQENTSDEWDIPRLYHRKGLHKYFIPCHRKYMKWPDGKVHWNTDKYTMDFLHSDWLYFLWHGITNNIIIEVNTIKNREIWSWWLCRWGPINLWKTKTVAPSCSDFFVSKFGFFLVQKTQDTPQ